MTLGAPLLYTNVVGKAACLDAARIVSIVANTSKDRPSKSLIQLEGGLPIDALEPPMTLFRRWVEVLAYSVPRSPENYPGYREANPEPSP